MQALIEHIKEAMPDLLLVDEDYGQLDMIDSEQDTYPLTMPAVLINADAVEWQNRRGLSQMGVATVRVNLILDCYDDHHYGSTTEDRIADRHALLRTLTEALQGFRPLGTDGAAMVRTASQFATVNHGIKVYSTTYMLEVYEDFEPATMKKEAVPRVDTEILDSI
jgi:hypothetical protein